MELEWKKDNVLKFKCVVAIILNTSILLETETVSFCWVTIQLCGTWASPLIDFRFETSTITRGNYCFCKFESTTSHSLYIDTPFHTSLLQMIQTIYTIIYFYLYPISIYIIAYSGEAQRNRCVVSSMSQKIWSLMYKYRLLKIYPPV